MISGIHLPEFDISALAIYAGAEVVAFLAAYALARHVFRREHLESWLLAMCVIFVNSLLYIWPISFLIYGEAAALPITAIVAFDAAISFAFFIISMELMAGERAQGGALNRIATNPVLIAILLGAVVNLSGLPVPVPLLTAMEFAGAAAAPLTLFALGVILSGSRLIPTPVVAGIGGMKLLAFPALVWAGMSLMLPGNEWEALFVLNAAGPSGAMAFALALLYKVRTDAIAPVIIWTSTLSLISLSLLA